MLPIPVFTAIAFSALQLAIRGGKEIPGHYVAAEIGLETLTVKAAELVAARATGVSDAALDAIKAAEVPVAALAGCVSRYGEETIRFVSDIMKSGDITSTGCFHRYSGTSITAQKYFTYTIAIAVVTDAVRLGYHYGPSIKEYFFPENTDTLSVEINNSTQIDAIHADHEL